MCVVDIKITLVHLKQPFLVVMGSSFILKYIILNIFGIIFKSGCVKYVIKFYFVFTAKLLLQKGTLHCVACYK